MQRPFSIVAGAAALLAASLAQAAPSTVSGQYGDLSWSASSNIVGVNSTATAAGGGDPRYVAPRSQYGGVATLIMDYGSAGSFICSGTLLGNQKSILTAGHCVSDGTTARPLSTTVHFYTGTDPDNVTWSQPSFSYQVTNYAVHQDYTGRVIDQNDIAVLTLDRLVDWSVQSYELFDGDDLGGVEFNVAGYGGRSDVGGDLGDNLGTGRLRQGDNRYDFRLGDDDFGGLWSDVLGEPASQIEHSWLSDFDNGLADNDAACIVAVEGFGIAPSAKYCDTGLGLDEVSIAGGDSGGPGFVGGKVASVNSYGLTFGPFYGDINPSPDGSPNSSFGEFNGFVPVSIHRDFIAANAVPEPGSYALAALALLGVGWQRRKQRKA